jgi:hypothetical protein
MSVLQIPMFDEPAPALSFEQDAYGFLIAYAARCKGQPFSAEDVTLAALEAGLAPQDLRAWGSLFHQAAKDGYIRRSDVLFRRSMGNSSLAPGWVGI